MGGEGEAWLGTGGQPGHSWGTIQIVELNGQYKPVALMAITKTFLDHLKPSHHAKSSGKKQPKQ